MARKRKALARRARAFESAGRIDWIAVANVFRSVMHCPVGPTSQVQRYALIAEVHAKLKRNNGLLTVGQKTNPATLVELAERKLGY